MEKQVKQVLGEEIKVQSLPLPGIDTAYKAFYREGDCLFALQKDESTLGYLLLTSAHGRFEHFNYGIIFSNELEVLNVKVHEYRSTHGHGIINKKWLSQFYGYRGEDLKVGKDIDAISGSTISVESITGDMQRSFLLVKTLIN